MNVTYEWKIKSLHKTTVNSLQDVVVKVMYEYVGTDSESGQTAFFPGVTPLPEPDANSFTPFENLTQQEVIEWLIANVDTTHMKVRVERDIEFKISPIEEVHNLPWDTGNL